jgi:hypothetical protein
MSQPQRAGEARRADKFIEFRSHIALKFNRGRVP